MPMPKLRSKHGRSGVDFRLGLGCGTWSRILYANSRKHKQVRAQFDNRSFYETMANRGIFVRCYDNRNYELTPDGVEMAEWIISVLPQNQVRIRWKRIPE